MLFEYLNFQKSRKRKINDTNLGAIVTYMLLVGYLQLIANQNFAHTITTNTQISWILVTKSTIIGWSGTIIGYTSNMCLNGY